MRKLIFGLFVVGLAFASCEKDSTDLRNEQTVEQFQAKSTVTHRNCGSHERFLKDKKENPSFAKKQEQIERFTQRYINAKKPDNPGGGNGGGGNGGGGGGGDPTPFEGTVTIPVYVHVVYSNAQQNISDAQVQSQIDVLNEDFNLMNSDAVTTQVGTPADVDISFILAATERHSDPTTSWGTNNAVKSAYPPVAGHLNMWVCNIGGNILGYAQFPGGPAATDGVVISPEFFGSIEGAYGNSTPYLNGTFNLGRTATHEVGHWLNLRHIWGDGRCKQDDFVTDTPASDRPNYGCYNTTQNVVHCRTADQWMNYMDYTNDACMWMFSAGQVDRMRALFAAGGVREQFVL